MLTVAYIAAQPAATEALPILANPRGSQERIDMDYEAAASLLLADATGPDGHLDREKIGDTLSRLLRGIDRGKTQESAERPPLVLTAPTGTSFNADDVGELFVIRGFRILIGGDGTEKIGMIAADADGRLIVATLDYEAAEHSMAAFQAAITAYVHRQQAKGYQPTFSLEPGNGKAMPALMASRIVSNETTAVVTITLQDQPDRPPRVVTFASSVEGIEAMITDMTERAADMRARNRRAN